MRFILLRFRDIAPQSPDFALFQWGNRTFENSRKPNKYSRLGYIKICNCNTYMEMIYAIGQSSNVNFSFFAFSPTFFCQLFFCQLFELFDLTLRYKIWKWSSSSPVLTYIGVWNFSRFGRKVFLTRTRPRLIVALHPFNHFEEIRRTEIIWVSRAPSDIDAMTSFLPSRDYFSILTRVKITTLLWNISLRNIFLNSISWMRKS